YNVRGLTRRAREIGAEAARRQTALACVALAAMPAELVELTNGDGVDGRIVEQLGDTCRRIARTSDAVGRLGQTELAVIAPATGADGAVRLAERLRETVEATEYALGDLRRRFKVRAGYYAVADFSQASIDA